MRLTPAFVAWLLVCGIGRGVNDAPQDAPKSSFSYLSHSIRFLRGDPAGSLEAGTVKRIGGGGSVRSQVGMGEKSTGVQYDGQWYEVRLVVPSVAGTRLKAKIAYERGTQTRVNGQNVFRVAESLQLNETYRLGQVIKLPSYKDPKGENVWAEIVIDVPKPSPSLPARR